MNKDKKENSSDESSVDEIGCEACDLDSVDNPTVQIDNVVDEGTGQKEDESCRTEVPEEKRPVCLHTALNLYVSDVIEGIPEKDIIKEQMENSDNLHLHICNNNIASNTAKVIHAAEASSRCEKDIGNNAETNSLSESLFLVFVGCIDETLTAEQVRLFLLRNSKYKTHPKTLTLYNPRKSTETCAKYTIAGLRDEEDGKSVIDSCNGVQFGRMHLCLMKHLWEPNKVFTLSGNIVVKKLPRDIDEIKLHRTFMEFGRVLSIRVARKYDGSSKGYAFIRYEDRDSAERALSERNVLINNKVVTIEPYESPYTRNMRTYGVYIKYIPESWTEGTLHNLFNHEQLHGIVMHEKGTHRPHRVAFANYKTREAAEKMAINNQGREGMHVERCNDELKQELTTLFVRYHIMDNRYVYTSEGIENLVKDLFSPFHPTAIKLLDIFEKNAFNGGTEIRVPTFWAQRAIDQLDGIVRNGVKLMVQRKMTKEEKYEQRISNPISRRHVVFFDN